MKSPLKSLDLDAFIALARPQFEQELAALVAIPTISADPAHTQDILRGADYAIGLLRQAGFTAISHATPGNPLITASLIQHPDYPTVTFYNHLDVQPADPAQWQTDPFHLDIIDGIYTGRGATDDKGPALTALTAIRYALKAGLKLNIKIIWELEEEVGSTNFDTCVAKNLDQLVTDVVVVSDTIWISKSKPAIPVGLRGLVTFEVSLRTGKKDVHSGLAGGAARNPLGELSQIISECYDATSGHVRIPGFYDAVKPLTLEERTNLASAGFTVEQFMADHELTSLRTTDTTSVMSRIMAEPTFEVHGITGGYSGPGVKTVIPVQATAKLSTRLVRGQDPQQIFHLIADFITAKHPDASVTMEASASPYLSDTTSPYVQAAARAVEFAFGTKPAFVREGGTIGAVLSLKQHLRVPIIMLGLSLPEHGYHAVGEHFDWRQASGGIKMFVEYFNQLSIMPRR